MALLAHADPILLVSVWATAILSGMFGMAGGLVLLFILTARMPLPEAMVLHGTAQLIANGTRALLSYRDVRLRVFFTYACGAAGAVLLCHLLKLVIDTPTALIITGLVPWLDPLLSRAKVPSVDTPHGAVACGAVVTTLHLTAGATGPLLDTFFLRTPFTRHQIVGTKAATQCLGHLVKIFYFGEVAQSLPSASSLPLIVLVSVVGTVMGRHVLDRMGDATFRSWARVLVLTIGTLCLLRGLHALLI